MGRDQSRNGLVKRGLKPSSANRLSKSPKSALNLATKDDPRINTKAWTILCDLRNATLRAT
jgi:hypothetical protein